MSHGQKISSPMSPWSASHPLCVKWRVWRTKCLAGVSNVLKARPDLSLYGSLWMSVIFNRETHSFMCFQKIPCGPQVKIVGLPHKYVFFQHYKTCLSLHYIHMPSCLLSPYSSRRPETLDDIFRPNLPSNLRPGIISTVFRPCGYVCCDNTLDMQAEAMLKICSLIDRCLLPAKYPEFTFLCHWSISYGSQSSKGFINSLVNPIFI